MTILKILFLCLWLYVLSVFYRTKLDFWKYCWGSAGLFIVMMFWLEPYLTVPLTRAVALVTGILGTLTKMFQSYFDYGILFISNGSSSISLYIDYECSGIIEIMAFSCLLWFFPVYSLYEKIIANIAGFIWIFTANVIRIFIICTLIYFYGNNIFYLAHTIFGRLVFYGFSIILYYYVFTKPHVIRQKVGGFGYEFN